MAIKGVLREELDNSIRMKKKYEEELSNLPVGSLIRKKIKGHEYYYIVLRENGKVKFIYKGKYVPEDLKVNIASGSSTEVVFPISLWRAEQILYQACARSGVRYRKLHPLRHTFACRMIAAEVPVTSVQKMLGHNSLRTTQLYVQVADRQVERDYHTGIQKVIENCSTLTDVSDG